MNGNTVISQEAVDKTQVRVIMVQVRESSGRDKYQSDSGHIVKFQQTEFAAHWMWDMKGKRKGRIKND